MIQSKQRGGSARPVDNSNKQGIFLGSGQQKKSGPGGTISGPATGKAKSTRGYSPVVKNNNPIESSFSAKSYNKNNGLNSGQGSTKSAGRMAKNSSGRSNVNIQSSFGAVMAGS